MSKLKLHMLIIMLYHFIKTVTLLAFFLTAIASSLKAMEDVVDKQRDSDATKSLTESEEGETTDRFNRDSNEYAAAPSGTPGEIDTFIRPGNLERLLSTVKYSGSPKRSYNNPAIQGILVFESQSDDPFIKARAFYLLHIVLDNKRVQTQNSSERSKFKNLSNKALAKSKDLLSPISDKKFAEQKEKWREAYVFEDERESIQRLTDLEDEGNWSEFETQYNSLDVKYISEAILLAKAAFHGRTAGSLEQYLSHANNTYYAAGSIEMGNYLATLAQSDLSKQTFYINRAKEFYRNALINHNDIRGYEYFISIEGEPDRAMTEKRKILKKMHDEMESTLIRLLK